tara:strand:- start:209 stop:640 length:432 start_codon:yes stop_codon:yes gene_type:complete
MPKLDSENLRRAIYRKFGTGNMAEFYKAVEMTRSGAAKMIARGGFISQERLEQLCKIFDEDEVYFDESQRHIDQRILDQAISTVQAQVERSGKEVSFKIAHFWAMRLYRYLIAQSRKEQTQTEHNWGELEEYLSQLEGTHHEN